MIDIKIVSMAIDKACTELMVLLWIDMSSAFQMILKGMLGSWMINFNSLKHAQNYTLDD